MTSTIPPDHPETAYSLSVQTIARHWEGIFQNAQTGMIIVSSDGRIFEANPAFCSLIGYGRGELIGRTFGSLTHPEDRARDSVALPKMRAKEISTYQTRKRYLHKNGESIWVDIVVQSMFDDESGELIGFFTTIADARLQQRIEEESRLAEERFRALSAVTHDGILLCYDNKIEDINDALLSLLCGTQSDWIGQETLSLFPAPERPRIADALAHHTEFLLETMVQPKEGSPVPVEMQVRNVQYRSRQMRGIAVRDISERKLVQEKMREAALHEEKLKMQAAAILELSSPLIPITDSIMVMPLIGTLDSQRAQRVMDTLLSGVSSRRAGTAIIDITGVPIVDSAVAAMLVKAAAGVRLLGANVILTGIRPEVARTLITLGADLESLITCGTLQAGIAYAMNEIDVESKGE